uniref:Uncharacterized protein n=1 Tax=Anopheles quadriannulatus TaxID=34691 RepID=A0A182XTR3_ANOQN
MYVARNENQIVLLLREGSLIPHAFYCHDGGGGGGFVIISTVV